jgi:hypothetical protein
LGESKYSAIGLEYKMDKKLSIPDSRIEFIKQRFVNADINCIIE